MINEMSDNMVIKEEISNHDQIRDDSSAFNQNPLVNNTT